MKDWAVDTVPPESGNEIQLNETSAELLNLFSRRRDLMYQVSVLIAAASALLQLSSRGTPGKHLGLDTPQLVSGFLAVSATLFCLRFVQLHAGIVYHGMRFALAESRVLKNDPGDAIGRAAKFNFRGVSIQIIFFFAIVSGFCVQILLSSLAFPFWVQAVGAVVVVASLTGWNVFVHHSVARSQMKQLGHTHPTSDGDRDALRSHYIASLGESHSDMICITAAAALQTFATFGGIQFMQGLHTEGLQADGAQLATLGSFLLASVSAILALIAVRIYGRLQIAISVFSTKLGWRDEEAFRGKLRDTDIGLIVIGALAAMSIAAFAVCGLQYAFALPPQRSEWIGAVVGLVFLVVTLFQQKRLQAKSP
jgi:hypothetical protein